jgi:hypothetical protein
LNEDIALACYRGLRSAYPGLPTFQTTLDGFASWGSAVDMINLLPMVVTLGGEIFAIIFGLLQWAWNQGDFNAYKNRYR